jgi:hypothetical protein
VLEDRREIGAEVNTEKTKYMIMTCHQNAGQNNNLLIDNGAIKYVAKFKYMGMKVTYQNLHPFFSFFLNHPLLPCSVKEFLLVNL